VTKISNLTIHKCTNYTSDIRSALEVF